MRSLNSEGKGQESRTLHRTQSRRTPLRPELEMSIVYQLNGREALIEALDLNYCQFFPN
ncbi:MAG: hypothetical protein PUP93_22445 [Rhizonema sp. NSF051]|nr:hypothetical protein [Rhizonema sp. NSF051]